MAHLVGKSRLVLPIADVEAVFAIGVLVGKGEHIPKADVLPSPDITNESLTLYTYGKSANDARVGNILELILALCKVLDVIMYTFFRPMFAS